MSMNLNHSPNTVNMIVQYHTPWELNLNESNFNYMYSDNNKHTCLCVYAVQVYPDDFNYTFLTQIMSNYHFIGLTFEIWASFYFNFH